MSYIALALVAGLVLLVSMFPIGPGNDVNPKTGKPDARSRWSA